jgi:hypothetical protein
MVSYAVSAREWAEMSEPERKGYLALVERREAISGLRKYDAYTVAEAFCFLDFRVTYAKYLDWLCPGFPVRARSAMLIKEFLRRYSA